MLQKLINRCHRHLKLPPSAFPWSTITHQPILKIRFVRSLLDSFYRKSRRRRYHIPNARIIRSNESFRTIRLCQRLVLPSSQLHKGLTDAEIPAGIAFEVGGSMVGIVIEKCQPFLIGNLAEPMGLL